MICEKAALITGGGSGIGAATAKLLAQTGWAVALVGRRAAKIEKVAEEIVAMGGKALAIPADLSDFTCLRGIVQQTVEAWGRLDLLVNDAAAIEHLPLEKATSEVFDAHIFTNVKAPYFLTQYALEHLEKSPAPCIVNISSSSASLAIPGQSMYGMSKAALEYLTKSLAAELAPRIRVNCIAPGPVDTPIHAVWAGYNVVDAYARMTSELPLARMGRAEELAAWIAWLASDEAGFVTGVVIPVDGGQTLPGALSHITQ